MSDSRAKYYEMLEEGKTTIPLGINTSDSSIKSQHFYVKLTKGQKAVIVTSDGTEITIKG